MVAQTRPTSDRQSWWRRRSGPDPGGLPDGSLGGSPDGSPGGLPDTSKAGLVARSPDRSLDTSPHTLPAGSPATLPDGLPGGSPNGFDDGRCLVQVLGDSAFVVDVDGKMAPSPDEYAVGLIGEYLQRPEYE